MSYDGRVKKIYLSISSFLFILFFLTPAKTVFAYQPASNCPDLPTIPISVSPSEGSKTTQFKVTLFWSRVSPIRSYTGRDVFIDAYDDKGPIGTGAIDPQSNPRTTDATYTLSNFGVPQGDYIFPIRIAVDQTRSCLNYQQNSAYVVVKNTPTPTPDSSAPGTNPTPNPTPAGLQVGDTCDPNLQNTPEFKCPVSAPCTKTTGTEYKCLGPTAQPNAPPPPCADGQLVDVKNSEDKIIGKKCNFVDSAIGNIATDPGEFIKTLFLVLLSMSGGWAVYIIITAGYQMMFSGSNPEQVQEAKDKIVSAVVGLIFMILSVAILQIIGADVFQFPGFKP